MLLRKASRKKAKIRLGLSSVSGGGKTVSALLIAYGMTGDWNKIAVIDTESESADLYANHKLPTGFTIGEFEVCPLAAPFTPERYIEAIKACEVAGMEVIIVDSITHEWDGKGGCLEIVDQLTQASSSKNSYISWGKVTPRHQAFIDALLQCKCHIITTVRRKQDYEMSKGSDGKIKVEKAGLKEITREGFEYELTVNLELDHGHHATASKDRTGLFSGKPEFVPSVATGQMIMEWCDSGADPAQEISEAISKLDNCASVDELKLFKETLPLYVSNSEEFKKAGKERMNLILTPKPATNAAAN
jgi:hypothetical protein